MWCPPNETAGGIKLYGKSRYTVINRWPQFTKIASHSQYDYSWILCWANVPRAQLMPPTGLCLSNVLCVNPTPFSPGQGSHQNWPEKTATEWLDIDWIQTWAATWYSNSVTHPRSETTSRSSFYTITGIWLFTMDLKLRLSLKKLCQRCIGTLKLSIRSPSHLIDYSYFPIIVTHPASMYFMYILKPCTLFLRSEGWTSSRSVCGKAASLKYQYPSSYP